MEVDKTYIFTFCQKVFDGGLGKKMNSSYNEAWQGQMIWENKRFHQYWVHLGKVANASFVNPRNQQKWTSQDLVMQTYSPWCTTWCSVIIWGSEHVHKTWDQKEKVANVELSKFGSGQEGFWGTLIKLACSPTCPFGLDELLDHLSMFTRFQNIWTCLAM